MTGKRVVVNQNQTEAQPSLLHVRLLTPLSLAYCEFFDKFQDNSLGLELRSLQVATLR